jgi:hypothetical protein
MVRFRNGVELDESFKSRIELEGHHAGFKTTVRFGMMSSGDDGFEVQLTSYAGNYFDVRIGVDEDPGYATVEDIVEGSTSTKEKLAALIVFALDNLSKTELLKVFSLMYKAGKAVGKNEVRKRFNQVMAIQ